MGARATLNPCMAPRDWGPAAGNGWYTADRDEPICETMERLGTLSFVSQPGDAFVYGYNTDILGWRGGEGFRHAAGPVHPVAHHRSAGG
jgi:hypothetical protein